MTDEFYGCAVCGAFDEGWDEVLDDSGLVVDGRCKKCGALESEACGFVCGTGE